MISNSNGKFVIVLHETILIEFLLALIFQFLTVSPMDWPLPRTALFGPIGTGYFEITEHSKKCQTFKKCLLYYSLQLLVSRSTQRTGVQRADKRTGVRRIPVKYGLAHIGEQKVDLLKYMIQIIHYG